MVSDSVTGIEKEIGNGWDALDVPGKKAMMDGGGEAIRLSKAEDDRLRKIGADVTESVLKGMEAKGMPSRTVYTMMKGLAEKHARTSMNFWA